MSTAAAVVLFVAITMYAVFGGADFGAGFWDLVAGGLAARGASSRGHRPLHRPGVGGEPRLARLRLRRAVDLLPAGVRVDHPDDVRPAHPGRPRRRPAGCGVRLPQGGVPHAGPAQLRRGVRALLGARALLPGRRRRGCRVRAGAGRWRRRRPLEQLGQPHVGPRRPAGGQPVRLPRGLLPRRRTPGGSRTPTWSTTSGVAPRPRQSPRASWRSSGSSCSADGAVRLRRPHLTGAAGRRPVGRRRTSARWCCCPSRPPGGTARRPSLAVAGVVVAWGVAQWDYLLPETLTVSAGAAPVRHHHGRPRGDRRSPSWSSCPRSGCCTSWTRSRCSPGRACPIRRRDLADAWMLLRCAPQGRSGLLTVVWTQRRRPLRSEVGQDTSGTTNSVHQAHRSPQGDCP